MGTELEGVKLPKKLRKLSNGNRLSIPKEAVSDLDIGSYVLFKWDANEKEAEIVPVKVSEKK